MKILAILLISFFWPSALALGSETVPLFSPKELKELDTISSPRALYENLSQEMARSSQEKMRLALKIYAKGDSEFLSKAFNQDIWKRLDKRENMEALKIWLQKISPIERTKRRKEKP